MVQPNLLSGEGRRNAYFSAFMDSQGTFHLAWTWRETPDVSTNHDLCYARSRDGGKTWTDSQDKVLPLPVTAASAEYAARIPQGSSLMNPPSVAAGSDGVPVIANYWISDDSGVPQWHLVRWQKEGWQTRILPVRRIPFVLGGTATKRPPISRASLLLRQNEDHTQAAFLVYRDDEQDGCVVLLSCPDLTRSAFHVRKLTSTRLDAWEPSVDSVQWARLGEVHLLLQEVHQPDGSDQAVARAPTPIASLITRP